jgi:vancomycin permeability regulator SanA
MTSFLYTAVMKILRKSITFIFALLAILLTYSIYQVEFFDSTPIEQKSDCLLIMGSRTVGHKPGFMLKERLDTALKHIYPHTKAVIVTGGSWANEKSEAAVARDYLIQNGVDPSKIFLEEKSTSSYENMMLSAQYIQSADCKDLDYISHDFHLARIKMIAERLGYPSSNFYPAETERELSWHLISREYLAYLWYLVSWKNMTNEESTLNDRLESFYNKYFP